MNAWELYVIFALGLVSSLHCIGMCGPLVMAYSLPFGKSAKSRQASAHLAYNAGRILTYTILGAVAGFVGGTVGLIGNLAGISYLLAIVTGLMMLAAGVVMLDLIRSPKLQKLNPLRFAAGWLKPLGGRIAADTVRAKFTLGIMLGLMPCGLIYAALLKSMATGTVVAGAMTMMAFGVGTALSLLVVGLFSSALSWRLGRWGNRLAAASVLLLGLVLIYRGAMPMMRHNAAPAQPEMSSSPSCHHE